MFHNRLFKQVQVLCTLTPVTFNYFLKQATNAQIKPVTQTEISPLLTKPSKSTLRNLVLSEMQPNKKTLKSFFLLGCISRKHV